ncbi:unnamed protein product, partial [Gadus morhua 'NCC']
PVPTPFWTPTAPSGGQGVRTAALKRYTPPGGEPSQDRPSGQFGRGADELITRDTTVLTDTTPAGRGPREMIANDTMTHSEGRSPGANEGGTPGANEGRRPDGVVPLRHNYTSTSTRTGTPQHDRSLHPTLGRHLPP